MPVYFSRSGDLKVQLKVENHAAGNQHDKLEGAGSQTAEIVTTPTDAAAAGDITISLTDGEQKKEAEAMGNSGSVTLTQIQPRGTENVAMGFVKSNGLKMKKGMLCVL